MKQLTLAVALAVLALPALPALAQQPADKAAPRPPRDKAAECRDKPLPPPGEGLAFSIDGDTAAVEGLKPHIRIWGLQAAELREKKAIGATGIETVPGMVGRAALEDLLNSAGHRVWYEPTKWDNYCRIVAVVTVRPPKLGDTAAVDLGLAMIMKGAAYGGWLDDASPNHPGLGLKYAQAEAFARENRVGLWSQWLGETK